MQRFMFLTPRLTRPGLYQFLPIGLEQARAWLEEGPEPTACLPLLSSIAQALTGQTLAIQPDAFLSMHTGDEALIAPYRCSGWKNMAWSKREKKAQNARQLSLQDVRERVPFGLLRKVAPCNSYTLSVTVWDYAFADRQQRYLVHDALLEQYGTYQYVRCDLGEMVTWLGEGPFTPQLQLDGACKALEILAGCDISLWDSSLATSYTLRPGDQALVVRFQYPAEADVVPSMPYVGPPLTRDYVRHHLQGCLLTRLSDKFLERHNSSFPLAQLGTRLPAQAPA